MDFARLVHRWDDLPVDHPMPTIARRRIIGEQAMISEVRLQAGCVVPTHHHENEQIAIVVSGRIRFHLGGEDADNRGELILVGGEVLHLPANLPHCAEAIEETLILDVFSPPSETTGIDESKD